MKLKCSKEGIIFKGKKLKKDEIIEVEKTEQLGRLQGMFSDVEVIDRPTEKFKINKKPRKKGDK